jgi:hypothetical protein
VVSLYSQTKQKETSALLLEKGLDDFTFWMTQDNQPILASVNYQTGELQFYSISEQGFVGKINATYYSEPELRNEVLKRKENSIYFPYGQESFSDTYTQDSFGASWNGTIRANYTETYKFITRTDDGVRLYINGKLILDKWQDMGTTEFSSEVQLMAGKEYSLKMEYYDRGGDAFAELSWESNSTQKSIIQEIGSFAIGYNYENQYGLETDWNANYFKGREWKEPISTRKETALSFTSNKEPFASGIPNENFCARYTANLKIPKSGIYTFITTSDDGVRLKLNGKLLIDQWTWMGATEFSEKMEWKKGDLVNVEVEYFQGGGGKYLKVEWGASNIPRQLLVKKGKRTQSQPNTNLDIYPGKIYSLDLNKDNKNDLVILHPTYSGKLSLLFQEPSGVLGTPISVKAGKDPNEILFADLNLDGKQDMIVVGKSSPTFLVVWNKNDDWRSELSPKWSESINKIVPLYSADKNISSTTQTFILIGKSGEMSKIQYMTNKGWSSYEPVSAIEKKEASSAISTQSPSQKCVSLSSKKQVCYDNKTRQLITYD